MFMIPLNVIGHSFDVAGKLIIALVTLRVHVKHFRTHHLETKDVRLDIALTLLGIALIIIGFVIRLPFEWEV